jgi:hypothetical protein
VQTKYTKNRNNFSIENVRFSSNKRKGFYRNTPKYFLLSLKCFSHLMFISAIGTKYLRLFLINIFPWVWINSGIYQRLLDGICSNDSAFPYLNRLGIHLIIFAFEIVAPYRLTLILYDKGLQPYFVLIYIIQIIKIHTPREHIIFIAENALILYLITWHILLC